MASRRRIFKTIHDKIGEPAIITKEEEVRRWNKIKGSTRVKKYVND